MIFKCKYHNYNTNIHAIIGHSMHDDDFERYTDKIIMI